MNLVIDPTPVALVIVALVLLAVSLTAVARPWRSNRPRLVDRWRIGAAVLRYDFWLDLRGTRRRRRRDLREELRANLEEAAERVGPVAAVAALGSLRQMAAGTVGGTVTGPRWSSGAQAAAVVLLGGMSAEMLAAISWAGGAKASGVQRVEGALPLFPGSLAVWESTGGGWSIELQAGWLVFAAVAIAFVLGSRPWLAARRRGTTSTAQAP